jgi:hypothetical protein
MQLARSASLLPVLFALTACGSSTPAGAGGSTSSSGAGGSGGAASSSSLGSGAGGAPATSAASTSSGSTGSGMPGCATAGLAVCEDFEGAALGDFPAGWGKRGDEWGDLKSFGVTDEEAMRGKHSLKVQVGNSGQQFMDYKKPLGGLATTHYGRAFFKVKTPAPQPASGVLHGDLVEGLGPHPGGGTNNVRWGIVENTEMKHQWIYNVQPDQGEPEFGEGSEYVYTWSGQWQCIEWYYDQPSQTGTMWLDGAQMPMVPGASHPAEIPVFTSLGVGWANYQDAGAGFTVYWDEVAFDTKRIGCDK